MVDLPSLYIIMLISGVLLAVVGFGWYLDYGYLWVPTLVPEISGRPGNSLAPVPARAFPAVSLPHSTISPFAGSANSL